MLSAGRPMMSRKIPTGKGLAKSSTKSQAPFAAHAATSAFALPRTFSSRAFIRAGEKIGFMMARNFRCSGGSISRGISLSDEFERETALEKVAAS